MPAADPAGWVLSGTHDGRKWVELDRREGCVFCSRFQEITGRIAEPSNYTAYKIEFLPREEADTVAVGDVRFYERDREEAWSGFVYPAVDFEVLDPQTEGAAIYATLVQDPGAYVRYHTRKVAEILFYSAADTMNTVGKIDYTLKDYAGVSAKSGNPAETAIVYSTQHIEKSARESLYKLDYETRGVLFHEMVHAFQLEPQGIPAYSQGNMSWAAIEGLADAVRTVAGYHDYATRNTNGSLMSGYQTTGFFCYWLTQTQDKDAIRNINASMRTINPWSWDAALKYALGEDANEQTLWALYKADKTNYQKR